jgi:hypothetical protein
MYACIYIYSHTHIYTHIYTYIHIHTYGYPVFATRSYTYTRGHPRMRLPTRLRTYAQAHRRSRRAQRPAPHRRPAERVPPAVARHPGRKGGAYLRHPGDTHGVPRADVRVERRRRKERLRAEPPAVDAGGARSHVSARMHGRPIARTHARAHGRTQHVRACVRRARTGDPFIRVARRATCMHEACMYLSTKHVRVRLMALR